VCVNLLHTKGSEYFIASAIEYVCFKSVCYTVVLLDVRDEID